MLETLSDLGPLYQDYGYAYPHKHAYRPFDAPRPLGELWAQEDKTRVFLYLHVPFCEMRCGFCNLFTLAHPEPDRVGRYLAALELEMAAARAEIGPLRPARLAMGGGTPTLLGVARLGALLDKIETTFGLDIARLGAAIETSPKTATPEMIALLAERRFERISIGVQSFIDEETASMGRPQRATDAEAALDRIRAHRFGRLNVDLIYGAANQTVESWLRSIRRALHWTPQEIYLYPLYVRPRTGLDGRAHVFDDHRRALYRAGRDLLLSEGYAQLSMRAFQCVGASADAGDEYSCQEDGMLGFGPGARSYTRLAHYATPHAVSRSGVLEVMSAYDERSAADFHVASHGFFMDAEEQMRRYVLKSILRRDGLDAPRFEALFGLAPTIAFPQLERLINLGLQAREGAHIRPTAAGLEHSDAITPLFYSDRVRERLAGARVS